MHWSQRKMLSSQIDENEGAHFEFVRKYSCSTCILKCPDECKIHSDTYDLSPRLPPPVSSSQKNHISVLMVMLCFLGAAFVFLCYLAIQRRNGANFRNWRRRNLGRDSDAPDDMVDVNDGPVVHHPVWYINTVGLQQPMIDSIPVFKYKKGEGLIQESGCSVCLSEFQEDEILRLLPKCDHAFHVSCIDTWLRSHKNCPLCRAPIVRESSADEPDQMSTEESGSGGDAAENDAHIDGNEVGGNGMSQMVTGVGNSSFSLPNPDGMTKERMKSVKNGRLRVLSDLGGDHVRVEEELQPIRRSISLDCASASRVYVAVPQVHPVNEVGCSKILEDVEKAAETGDGNSRMDRTRKSFSFALSLHRVPVCMKRSLSSNGKFSLPRRNTRSYEFVRTSRAGSRASSSGLLG